MNTPTTVLYPLSLHDALPISLPLDVRVARRTRQLRVQRRQAERANRSGGVRRAERRRIDWHVQLRSEEHTSELQSLTNLVCRLLLEKKKKNKQTENK